MVKMFKPQFAPLVEAGTKTQTVRPMPKRFIRAGDPISLRAWVGKPYRSKQRVLREAVVTESRAVLITNVGIIMDGDYLGEEATLKFVKADGFGSWNEMRDWFSSTHGLPFPGLLIQWK